MIKDPYKTLGVPKSANKDSIKRAYRRKAKVAHPDKGGNADVMAALNAAYALLSDDTRRENYDTTGETKEDNNRVGKSLGFISQMFQQALAQEAPDPVNFCRTNLKAVIDELTAKIEHLNRRVASLGLRRSQVVTPDGVINLYTSIIDNELQTASGHIRKMSEDQEVLKDSLKLMDDYRFTGGYTVQTNRSMFGSTTSTTWR